MMKRKQEEEGVNERKREGKKDKLQGSKQETMKKREGMRETKVTKASEMSSLRA